MTGSSSTLTAENTGTDATRLNALKHGILSRHTVLPWEDTTEYQALVSEIIAEHTPQGPIEEHLVEELAGILWRKRRLRLAEAATYHHGLEDAIEPHRRTVKAALVHLGVGWRPGSVIDTIRMTPQDAVESLRDTAEDEAMTARALKLLQGNKADVYKKAVAALRSDTRQEWQCMLDRRMEDLEEGEEPMTPDVEGLRQYILNHIMPLNLQMRREMENHQLICTQAFGQSHDSEKLAQLARYEVHLDRKLERMLAMLFKLKDIRLATGAGKSVSQN